MNEQILERTTHKYDASALQAFSSQNDDLDNNGFGARCPNNPKYQVLEAKDAPSMTSNTHCL
jgi:hypothetical protein